MLAWTRYPTHYRSVEVRAISAAVKTGASVMVVGLSGAGKSNLLGFLAHRAADVFPSGVQVAHVDGNRLTDFSLAGFYRLVAGALESPPSRESPGGPFADLEASLNRRLQAPESSLCLLLDLSLLLDSTGRLFGEHDRAIFGNLRALRDNHKFQLTYVAATRHPLPPDTELSELFYANTLCLGGLDQPDARWSIADFAVRAGLDWRDAAVAAIIELSGGFPSLLRAICEAHAAGAPLDLPALAAHPAVRARLLEFWADHPTDAELQAAGLLENRLLMAGRPAQFDTSRLTAKEHLLLQFLLAQAGRVCDKDEVIRAVWPEDHVFDRGVRDDSLAQLVHRLRTKIEPDPANPQYLHTVAGRGYRLDAP